MAGREIHAPLLRETAGLRVTHVVTSNAERAEAARAELPGVTVVPSADDVWDIADRIDLAILASPNTVHFEQAVAAIETGTALVVDKPLATDAGHARGVVELAAERAVPLTVFQNRRWDSDHLTARRRAGQGAIGDVIRLEPATSAGARCPSSAGASSCPPTRAVGCCSTCSRTSSTRRSTCSARWPSVYAELAALSTVGARRHVRRARAPSPARAAISGATALAAAPGPRLRLLGRDAAYVVAAVDDETTAFRDWLDPDADHRGWLVRGDERSPVARGAGELVGLLSRRGRDGARRCAAAGRPARCGRGARGARRGAALGPRARRGQPGGMTGSNSSGSVLRGISHSTPTSTIAEATTPRNTLCDASNSAERVVNLAGEGVVGDRTEHGHAHGAAEVAAEQVGAGDDAPALPVDHRLHRDDGRSRSRDRSRPRPRRSRRPPRAPGSSAVSIATSTAPATTIRLPISAVSRNPIRR